MAPLIPIAKGQPPAKPDSGFSPFLLSTHKPLHRGLPVTPNRATLVRRFFCLPPIFLCLLFAGCLVYQTIDYRITLNPDGKSGTIAVEYTNVESSATDSAGQREDFEELMSNWKSDAYLLGRMDDGIYVKGRSLTLSKGVLVWKENGVFADIRKLKEGITYNDTTRVTIPKDQTVLSTNGAVDIGRDSTVVSWPPRTREFRVRIQQRNFEHTSHFAQRFAALKKK